MKTQNQSVTEGGNHFKTSSKMSYNDSMVSKKSQLADQLKSKFVKKYGRDASPTIDSCVTQIMLQKNLNPNELDKLEEDIKSKLKRDTNI